MEGSSYMISSMTSSSTARRPRAPVPRFIASRATAATASSVNLQPHLLQLEVLLVLLDDRVLGLAQDADERRLVEVVQGGHHGQPPDELRDEPVLQQVLGLHHGQQVAHAPVLAALDLGPEAHAASRPPASPRSCRGRRRRRRR